MSLPSIVDVVTIEPDPDFYPDDATVAAMQEWVARDRQRWPSATFVDSPCLDGKDLCELACDPDPMLTGAWDACRDTMTTDVTDLGCLLTNENRERLMRDIGLDDYAEIMRGHVASGWQPNIISREECCRQGTRTIVKKPVQDV